MENKTSFDHSDQKRKELSFRDIIDVFNRRKKTILLPVIIVLILVIIYNLIAKPTYESNVLLKKEKSSSTGLANINDMFMMTTLDEIDTEMGIMKSRTVLEKVIHDLNLFFTVQKIEYHNGRLEYYDLRLPDFQQQIKTKRFYRSSLPNFSELELSDPNTTSEFFIEKLHDNLYRLFDIEMGSELIASSSPLIMPFVQIGIEWPNSTNKDKIYFKIDNIETTLKYIRKNISINKEGKSDIFKLSVTSDTPYLAQLIASTIANKYREVRLEQKRQTTHNSFQFVDDQLQEVSEKLKEAEIALSNFKSENKIAIMDESSKDLIESLSSLESEKIKTELELAQYRNKARELRKEFEKKGYFDQTFLTPVESSSERTPFSLLLEQLTDAEIRRLELLQRRKETHPDVVTLDEQISKIKQKLADYNQNTLTSYNILIRTLQRKRYNLIQLIEKYSSKIEKLPDQETELVELMREKNVYEKMFTLLLDKREELRMAEFSKLQDIVIVDNAQLPFKPISPRKKLNIALGIVFGFIIGLVRIVFQEIFEKRIATVEDIENKYSYPVLAVIPQYSKQIQQRIRKAEKGEEKLVNLMDDQHIFNESYRVIRTKLINYGDKNIKPLIFTSCEEDTGKTTVVTNLATSFATVGKKVLILDCDLRNPSVSKFFNNSDNKSGIIQVLSDNNKTSVRKYFSLNKNGNYRVDYISSGGISDKSAELLESPKMKQLIDRFSPKYDYIFIDTPPITRTADTLVLSKYIKHIVLVVKPYHTFKDSVALGIDELEEAGMKILGFIVNAGNFKKMSYRYKYGYGYGYSFGKKT